MSQDKSVINTHDDIQYPAILFSKIRWALGYKRTGWYIDKRGYVETFSYDLAGNRLMINPLTNYRKIDSSTLDSMTALVRLAAAGPLSLLTNQCNDFGAISYSAFMFDSAAQGYREILLYQAGDWARKNESDAGKKLTNWLMTIDSMNINDFPCKPE
jgi:hypothetical protein